MNFTTPMSTRMLEKLLGIMNVKGKKNLARLKKIWIIGLVQFLFILPASAPSSSMISGPIVSTNEGEIIFFDI